MSNDPINIAEAQKLAKKDMIFLISFFRLHQPFRVYMNVGYDYKAGWTGKQTGMVEATVKIKGRKQSLHSSDMNKETAEEFLMHSIRCFESKKFK
jgi:hypothetical protein